MNQLLSTILLSDNESTYLIDLIKPDSGKRYVRIEYIHDQQKCSININPKILADLIEVLNNYNRKIGNKLTVVNRNIGKIPKELQDKSVLIQNRYLKGVPLKDLAIQFDCDEYLIEMILQNREIEIVPNNIVSNWEKIKKVKGKGNRHHFKRSNNILK